MKKICFTILSVKGTFFGQIVKTKVFSYYSKVMFLIRNKIKVIFFSVSIAITISFEKCPYSDEKSYLNIRGIT